MVEETDGGKRRAKLKEIIDEAIPHLHTYLIFIHAICRIP